jgi:hypothetical protein
MASNDSSLFKKYINKVFVETGSCVGVGINRAIEAGFEEIYSIELSEKLFEVCTGYFKDNSKVHLYFGDSRFVLKDIIDKIDEPITFWLDAHRTGGLTVGELAPPLFEELEQIKNHHIKAHTIMIDDLRCWGNDWNERLKKEILTINPNYKFIIEDGTFEKDVLVAVI